MHRLAVSQYHNFSGRISHVGSIKLEWKATQLYVRLRIILYVSRHTLVSLGIIRYI